MPRITIPAAGLGKLAASIVGGQSAYDEGMEQGATAQSKIAQALASIRANNAAADLNSTKADAEREALARQAPGAIRENAMTRFGVPLDERGSVESFLNSGNLGGKYTPVPDDLGGGPVAPEPSWAKDLGGVAQAIAGMQEALTLGDKSVKNVAEAEGLRRNSRLSDAIIAGTADRNTVGGAQAAVDGKPLFDSNEYGSMDNFTGKVDDSGGAAQRFGQYRGAQTGKEKELAGAARANAAQSYASADSSRATAAKTRQEMELGSKGVLQQTDQGLLLVDPRTGLARPVLGPDGKTAGAKTGAVGGKPMPATALKMQNEALDMIGIASSIQADLGTIQQQLETGALDFGPVKNLANQARNMAGMSTEESRNFSTFKSSMEKLRNDSLRLNKGVQTDGDAQRAWNELFQNINDPKLVGQRLDEIKKINARAVDLRKREVEDIRNNYNQHQYDFGTQTNVPSAITPPTGVPTADAIEAEIARRAAARGAK